MLTILQSVALLAQATVDNKDLDSLREAARRSTPKILGADVTVVLAIGLGLTAVLFFWAFFIRKRPKRARGALVVNRDKHSAEAYSASGRKKRRKKRPDHPDNWGRNPTLGETGGLPPVRPPDEQPHSPSEPESPPAR